MKRIVMIKYSDGTEEWVSPQRLLDIFNEYRFFAAGEILARTPGFNVTPEEIAEVARAFRAAQAEALSVKNKANAAAPRNDVTRAQLEAFRDAYIAQHGHERGWRKVARSDLKVSLDLIRKRMSE